MNIHAFQPLAATLITIALAIFVYARNRENPVNRSFSWFLICVAFWSLDVFGIRIAPDDDFAEFWAKIFRPGLLFIPAASLNFVVHFLGLNQNRKFIRTLLLLAFGNSFFFSIANWTPYLTGDAVRYAWGYSIQSGPLFPIFLISFFAFMGASFILLIQNFFRVDRYQQQRIKYFLIALIGSFIGGSISFFPVMGAEVYPIGSLAVTISLFIATYSIAQHRLMAVSVFMAKGLGYVLTLAIMGVPAYVFIILLEMLFFVRIEPSFAIFIIMMGVVAVLLFPVIKEHVDRAMHQIIVKDRYDYHRVLDEFSRRLVTIIDLNRLLNMFADTIEKSMGVNQISIFLHEGEKEIFRARLIRGSPGDEVLKLNPAGIQFLQERKEAILLVDLERTGASAAEKELLNIMVRLQAEVCLPLIYMNRLIGFINLGSKVPEEMYFQEDLDLLYPLGNQVAIAIENANLYENLKKSQTIMRRADRLASLGTLIASLAHEIRNPLVSIKTFTQLLPERIDDEEFRNYFLKVASGEIDRLTGLINELLGFARPSEPRLEGEDVNSLIDKMEILVATEARKKNVTLNKNYARDLPQIKADAEQLKQVLLNLLLNAIQSTKGEGKIWIETRQVQVPIEDKVEPFTQIEVRDTGVGIPKENLERIFDPFFSTRPEGSGLGLAISHQIIHDHGGFISVESEVGKGTSFKVHLPLKPGGKGADQQ
jgi:signal transduction histidine kinase